MSRIGIPAVGSTKWPGGINYTEMMVKALHLLPISEKPFVSLVFEDPELLNPYENVVRYADEIVLCGSGFDEVKNSLPDGFRFADNYHVELATYDAILPWPHEIMGEQFNCAYWIPDFQHRHLPQMFSPQEAAGRDGHFASYANHAKVLVVSSESAKKDFKTFYPESHLDPFILRFHANPNDDWYQQDAAATATKYKLPEKFIICCNQFWQHKNHVTLFNAIALLKQNGHEYTLVCTGPTEDYRCPEFFGALMDHAEKIGIREQIHILGLIPRADQIQLIRRAALLVQPSMFEGWSTVVEDARVLGKEMLLSDISVHKEQSPEWSEFFEGESPQDLANKILSKDLKTGPDLEKEKLARANGASLALNYAKDLLALVSKFKS